MEVNQIAKCRFELLLNLQEIEDLNSFTTPDDPSKENALKRILSGCFRAKRIPCCCQCMEDF